MRIRKRASSVIALGALVTGGLLAGQSSELAASAAGGPVGGSGSLYYLNDSNTGMANRVLSYGNPDDQVLVGDWDGNGTDTLAVRRGNSFYLRNSLTSGVADRVVSYGDNNDVVLVGDWDGDGTDTLAVRRGFTYFIRNSLTSGVADQVVSYGDRGDSVLVGDWDGDGSDSLAVRRGGRYLIRNSLTSGVAEQVVAYGNADDDAFVGRWNGRSSSIAVRRGATYYVKKNLGTGVADTVFAFGEPTDTTLVGDWDGDGVATLGVRRAPAPAESSYAQQLVAGVNAQRAAHGLPALSPSACAGVAAGRWASTLASTGQFKHQDLGGVFTQCPGARRVAENIAKGYRTPDAAVAGWMASPGHRANILNPALRSVGSAAVQDRGGQWVSVHVFTD